MHDDVQTLGELNVRIGQAENDGDRAWLAAVLAPRLAFQRADEARTVDDHVAFLQKVAPGGTRRTTIVEPIDVYGDRAIVRCLVAADGGTYDNLRLFVRREGAWKLLGWANERAST